MHLTIDNLDILVAAHPKKECLTKQFLDKENIPYKIHYGKDYNWGDTEILQKYFPLTGGSKGAYLCTRNHIDTLKLATKKYILVLEDDAVPNDEHWLDIVLSFLPALEKYEIISMHGRDWDRFPWINLETNKKYSLILPMPVEFMKGISGRWVLGSLSYILKKDSAAYNRLITEPYMGIPMDLHLANSFNFALVNPSPFNHDRSKGSLVDNAPFDYQA